MAYPPGTQRVATSDPNQTIRILQAALPPFLAIVVLDICWAGAEVLTGSPDMVGPPLWIVKFLIMAAGGYFARTRLNLSLPYCAPIGGLAWIGASLIESLFITPFFYPAPYPGFLEIIVDELTDIGDLIEALIIGGIFSVVGALFYRYIPPNNIWYPFAGDPRDHGENLEAPKTQ